MMNKGWCKRISLKGWEFDDKFQSIVSMASEESRDFDDSYRSYRIDCDPTRVLCSNEMSF